MAAQLSSNLGRIIGQAGRGAEGAGKSLLRQTLADSSAGLFQPDTPQLDLSDPAALMQAAQVANNAGDTVKAAELVAMARQAQASGASKAAQQQAARSASQQGITFRNQQRDRLTAKGAANDQALGDIKTRESLMEAVNKTGNKALISAAPGMDNKSLSAALVSASTPFSGDGFLKGTPPTVADDEGNQWIQVNQVGKDGTIKTTYIPITSGGGQPDPKARLSVVSPTTGVDAFGANKAAAQGRWDEDKEEIARNLPTMIDSKIQATSALKILTDTATGGFNAQITGLQNFFNLEGTVTQAQLSSIMGKYVLDQIKKLGVNPTDKDLSFLLSTVQNMGKSTLANIGLFQKSLKILNRTIEANEFVLNNPTASRADYVKEYKRLAEKSGESDSGTINVNFSDRD